MARHGLRWVPGGGTHHEEFLLSWDDEAGEAEPTLTCEAILVRRELATAAWRADLGLKNGQLQAIEAKQDDLAQLHPTLDFAAYQGTHMAVTDAAICARVFPRLHAEHRVLNEAQALIEAELPDALKAPVLDWDGDPVIEDGRPKMALKRKHALVQSGARGRYHFVLPVKEADRIQALLDSRFDGRVTVEGS